MALYPILPVIAGECLTSYLNRSAQWHCGMGLHDFLAFVDLPRAALTAPGSETLDRLEGLLGLPVSRLGEMTFTVDGDGDRMLAGLPVQFEFGDIRKSKYCPKCLLEDLKPDSPSQGVPVGRIGWQVAHIRSCPVHGVALLPGNIQSSPKSLQMIVDITPDQKALAGIADQATAREWSGLEAYVSGRLSGQAGPAWLDEQPIDVATRACEMLGMFLLQPPMISLSRLGEEDWHQAGKHGFEIAARGGEAIRAALQERMDAALTGDRSGGAQKVFGCLYKWLQYRQDAKGKGPIGEVVRELFLDHFPYELGTMLFGEPVDRQRVHSVYSLAKKAGITSRAVQRAAILNGLLDAELGKPRSYEILDAEEGEALTEMMLSAMSIAELAEFLGSTFKQAEDLVRVGLISRMHGEDGEVRSTRKTIVFASAEAFLEDLLAQAERVKAPSEGMMSIDAAVDRSRWPALDVFQGILSGALSRVEIVDPELKVQGLLVDPVEVRDALARMKGDGRVGSFEAAALLGMRQSEFRNLARLRGPDGTPYLAHHVEPNTRGRGVKLFDIAGIEAFLRDYVLLQELAAKAGVGRLGVKYKLDALGITPINDATAQGRLWYRRADIEGALG
ncbi:MAG: hypothetical protein CMM86_17510 [Rhodovulum sp.]|nr:hypothetical protein [Rhodovulum sp.]